MPTTFDDDWIAFPHAVRVLAELLTVLEESRIPAPCTSTVVPGDLVALDYIGDECDSFAWARITQVFPSVNFPQVDERPNRTLTFAIGLELGLVRRMPIPDNGEAPTVEEHYDTTRAQMADMRAMLQTICQYAGEDIPLLLGMYLPLGPDGGVVGGTWSATIGSV